MFILRANRRSIRRLNPTLFIRALRRLFSIFGRPHQTAPRLLNLMRIRPTLMQINVRHIHRFNNRALAMINMRPNTKRRNSRSVGRQVTMYSQRSIQHMNTNRHKLTRQIRLLLTSTMTHRMFAVRNKFRVRSTILRVHRRPRSLKVLNLNRHRHIRLNMVIRMTMVLRRMRHRTLTQGHTIARLTRRQLPMTLLPSRIKNLT